MYAGSSRAPRCRLKYPEPVSCASNSAWEKHAIKLPLANLRGLAQSLHSSVVTHDLDPTCIVQHFVTSLPMTRQRLVSVSDHPKVAIASFATSFSFPDCDNNISRALSLDQIPRLVQVLDLVNIPTTVFAQHLFRNLWWSPVAVHIYNVGAVS